MSNLDLTTNATHPIHDAMNELHGLARTWLAGVQSPEVAKIRSWTARALGAVQVASAGRRCTHFLGVASESLMLARSRFDVLFLEQRISEETVADARKHIHRILLALEQLKAVSLASWSTVELPALAPSSQNLEEDPTIRPLRRILTKVAKAARIVAEREKRRRAERNPTEEGSS
jgi:hypothetical protein